MKHSKEKMVETIRDHFKDPHSLHTLIESIRLTVDIHPDGLDGWRTEAVLSLAVVASALVPQDLCDDQSLVEHAGVLKAI